MSEQLVPTNIAPKTAATVGAGGISVALISIIQWALSYWHIVIPPDVAVAFSTLLMGAASYLAPRQHQPIPVDVPKPSELKPETPKV